MDKVGTLRWDGAADAKARMENLLSAFTARRRSHAVLSPLRRPDPRRPASLKGVGYCTARHPCPVVSGQDAEASARQVHRSRVSSPPPCSRTRVHLATLAPSLVDAGSLGKTSGDQRHQDLTERREGRASCRCKPVAVTRRTEEGARRHGYYKDEPAQVGDRHSPRRSALPAGLFHALHHPRATQEASVDDVILDMRGITKHFHGVTALANVNLSVRAARSTPWSARTAPASPR